MTSLYILNLVLFILTFLTTNTQAKLVHQKKDLNGENLLLIYVFDKRLFKNIRLTFSRGFRKNLSRGLFLESPENFSCPKSQSVKLQSASFERLID